MDIVEVKDEMDPNQKTEKQVLNDEGRNDYFMDIDRMVNEGLGGGRVTEDNGLIEETTVETMDDEK